MSRAVGGDYLKVGEAEKEVLIYSGLQPKMKIIDYGCGSGRLAHALPVDYNLEYLGIYIIDELLGYAATQSPKNYQFINRAIIKILLFAILQIPQK